MLTQAQKTAARHLIEYFNGFRVAENSIKLQIPALKQGAQEFFKVREAIGMDGYLDPEEAMARVVKKLFNERVE